MKIPKSKLTPIYETKDIPVRVERSRGLGDTIKKILQPIVKGTPLEHCKGCQKRQEQLNKIIPFNQSE